MGELILTWYMIGVDFHKYTGDMTIRSYATKAQCVEAAAGWEEWSCLPALLPLGNDLTVVNSEDVRYCEVPSGYWFQAPTYEPCAQTPPTQWKGMKP